MKVRWIILLWAGVRGPLVLSDCWPECSNLASCTEDVKHIDGLEQASETAGEVDGFCAVAHFPMDKRDRAFLINQPR